MTNESSAKTFSEVIYLEPGFITDSYEKLTEDPVPIHVTKSCEGSGELSLGIIKGGATTKVEKQYSVSISKMYEKLLPQLLSFPEIDWQTKRDVDLPEMFWLEGVFGLSRSGLMRGDKELGSSAYYSFCPSLETRPRRDMPLATNDAYFTPGYDQLSRHALSMACAFAIRARLLVKLLYLDPNYPVGALMVGIKLGYI
jgi:hypothetical protein